MMTMTTTLQAMKPRDANHHSSCVPAFGRFEAMVHGVAGGMCHLQEERPLCPKSQTELEATLCA